MDAEAQMVAKEDLTNYSEVFAKVKEGNTVVVTFGLSMIPPWAPADTVKACDSIPGDGLPDGVYRCWMDRGVPTLVRLYPPCVNGLCPIR